MFYMRWGEVVDEGEEPALVGTDQEQDHGETGNNEVIDHEQEDDNEDPQNVNENNIQEEQQLRRLSRQVHQPRYLDNYLLQSVVECERLLLMINDKPSCFNEAKGLVKWTLACADEIDFINKEKTWFLVEITSDMKVIDLKWVLKLKKNDDNTINKHNARLVAKGYVQESGINVDEVFAPVARIETILLLIALAASHGWKIHYLDVMTAFLHGELREDVYV